MKVSFDPAPHVENCCVIASPEGNIKPNLGLLATALNRASACGTFGEDEQLLPGYPFILDSLLVYWECYLEVPDPTSTNHPFC